MEKSNILDFLKIFLSLVVLVAHTAGLSQYEDLIYYGKYFNADFAVKAFFVISGYLVTKSYLNSNTLSDYYKRRFFRIYPGYFTVILFGLIVGWIATNLNSFAYISSVEIVRYLLLNGILANFLAPTLPGVFTDNNIDVVNGSLWTIKIEVGMYLIIPLIFAFKNHLKFKWLLIILYIASTSWYAYFTYYSSNNSHLIIARQLPGQLSYFAIGMWMSLYVKQGRKLLIAAAVCLIALFSLPKNQIYYFLEPLLIAIPIIYIGVLLPGKIIFKKIPDISYGVYLYHFPIIQTLLHFNVTKNAILLLAYATAITIIFAFLSFKYIEKPAIRFARNI